MGSLKYTTFHYRPKQFLDYIKTCLKRPLKKKTKIGFQYLLSLNAGQKYCRMLQEEHSAILLAFIKLPFVIKIFVLSIFEWQFAQVLLYFPTLGLEVATYMAQKNVSSIHVLVRGECPLENVFGKRVGSVFKKVI